MCLVIFTKKPSLNAADLSSSVDRGHLLKATGRICCQSLWWRGYLIPMTNGFLKVSDQFLIWIITGASTFRSFVLLRRTRSWIVAGPWTAGKNLSGSFCKKTWWNYTDFEYLLMFFLREPSLRRTGSGRDSAAKDSFALFCYKTVLLLYSFSCILFPANNENIIP